MDCYNCAYVRIFIRMWWSVPAVMPQWLIADRCNAKPNQRQRLPECGTQYGYPMNIRRSAAVYLTSFIRRTLNRTGVRSATLKPVYTTYKRPCIGDRGLNCDRNRRATTGDYGCMIDRGPFFRACNQEPVRWNNRQEMPIIGRLFGDYYA